MKEYIARRNETETDFPYTYFHLVLTALVKTITLRPKMNRFIVNGNFFAVKNGTVYTKGDGVLQGTMRAMVLTICEKVGIPVCLDAPRVEEIPLWDACFLTSTSRFVMNIDTLRVGML